MSRFEKNESRRRSNFDDFSKSDSDSISDSDTAENREATDVKNVFKNDGSFLEMFRKAQAASGASAAPNLPTVSSQNVTHKAETVTTSQSGETASDLSATASSSAANPAKKPKTFGFIGKRRAGKVLPTGKVKKVKQDEEDEAENSKDAWSRYLAEVKKYRGQSCQEEGAIRPLVK